MIPDSHLPLGGLRPILFTLGGFPITSYALFMVLGVAAALVWHHHVSKTSTLFRQHSGTIVLSALFFGSLGAKLFALVVFASQHGSFGFTQFLYAGRSIVGGLLGGWFGVLLVKRCLRIRTRHGNAIAPAAALGIAIGRIGCFLGSCCYGQPTSGWLGADFGDGQRRHPTQVYEALFALALFLYLSHQNRRHPPPGVLFRHFLIAYFGFRFLIEFIRVEPRIGLGLTIYQLSSLAIIGLAAISLVKRERINPAAAPADGDRSASRQVC